MQHEPARLGFLLLGVGIDRVANERVPQMQHVDAYLVRTPGVQSTHNQGGVCGGIVLEHFVVRNGGFTRTGIHHCHFEAVDGVAPYVGKNGALGLFGAPLYNSQVYFACVSLCKLSGEGEVGAVIFCHNDASAGIFVQTVNNAGALYTAYAG